MSVSTSQELHWSPGILECNHFAVFLPLGIYFSDSSFTFKELFNGRIAENIKVNNAFTIVEL